jgi:hypothetical protein
MHEEDEIQEYPVSDSFNYDAFEGIVELYYQISGYITSSGKWFWNKTKGKKQRGYQDIDILAIKNNETLLISVSTNLDDKINKSKKGKIKTDINNYFEKLENFLTKTKDYKWLLGKDREVRKIIFVSNAQKKCIEEIENYLELNKIEIKRIDEAFMEIIEYLRKYKSNKKIPQTGLRIQNQLLRLMELLIEKDLIGN